MLLMRVMATVMEMIGKSVTRAHLLRITSGRHAAPPPINTQTHTTHHTHLLMVYFVPSHARLSIRDGAHAVVRVCVSFFTHPGCCRRQSPSARVSYRVI